MRLSEPLLTLLAGILLSVSGCTKPGASQEFLSAGDIQLEYHGDILHKYDQDLSQIAFNRDRCEFRVGTDNMSDYFSVKLDHIPTTEGEEVSATVSWTTYSSVMTKKNITLEAVKLEGDRIWLWNSEQRLGVTVECLY